MLGGGDNGIVVIQGHAGFSPSAAGFILGVSSKLHYPKHSRVAIWVFV